MTPSDSDVAIIGMACRFPGAESVEEFWKVLREGRETLRRLTDDEVLAAGVPAEWLADPRFVKAVQTFPGTDLFDAELFGIARDEAEIMDPQQRVFLECALTAIEDAGCGPGDGRVGVYAGAGLNTYLLRNLAERYRTGSSVERYRLMLANDKDFLATRVAYKLDLRGPCLSINTACSTSLVAVHLACLGLVAGECDTAVVGAVHVDTDVSGYRYQDGMIFSPDGHCRPFDRDAQGTIIGNGVGVVVLKRLDDALADGDCIRAVIIGSAVNNDGAVKTGYTAPSIPGQTEVITDALAVADVDPAGIGYVEAHGTGTPLGDPIEVAALTDAYRRHTDATGYCALGSVKSNLGHLDTAAGMAGLIKTVLMLQHGMLVPSLHVREPNPELRLDSSPFYVNSELQPWPGRGGPRLAGVSSFGIGGTNAHVVLREAAARQTRAPEPAPELVMLSAASESALRAGADALARQLRRPSELDLAAVAQTLALARRARAHRLAVVADDRRGAAMALAVGDRHRVRTGHAPGEPVLALLVASGSAVDPTAAAGLHHAVAPYREAVAACSRALGGSGDGADLLAEPGRRAGVVHEYAVAKTLQSWGVGVAGVAGESRAGRAVAAALSEALPLDAALALADGVEPERMSRLRLPVLSPRTGRWMSEDEGRLVGVWLAEDAGAAPSGSDVESLHPVRLRAVAGSSDARTTAPSGALAGLLDLVARLWTAGVDLDLAAVYGDRARVRVPLPTYPFERRGYVITPPRPSPSTEPQQPRPATASLSTRLNPDDPEGSLALVMDYLAGEIGGLLGDPAPPLDGNLFDLGLDSLALIGVVARLSDQVGVEVPATPFVEFPTIRSFTGSLSELLGLGTPERTHADPLARRISRRAERASARALGGAQ